MEKHEVSPYNERKLYLSMGVVSYWIFTSFVFTNLVFCDMYRVEVVKVSLDLTGKILILIKED